MSTAKAILLFFSEIWAGYQSAQMIAKPAKWVAEIQSSGKVDKVLNQMCNNERITPIVVIACPPCFKHASPPTGVLDEAMFTLQGFPTLHISAQIVVVLGDRKRVVV